jgi:hypothetical protein
VGDPWDLRKVAHLHRRAGFGATRAELLRELKARPDASVERLFHPRAMTTEETESVDSLRQTAQASQNVDLLKVCWLNRILHGPDPLREKLTLFWHGHFVTSINKGTSAALMDRQNETLRTRALGLSPSCSKRSSPTGRSRGSGSDGPGRGARPAVSPEPRYPRFTSPVRRAVRPDHVCQQRPPGGLATAAR